jgi:hypothetical protein
LQCSLSVTAGAFPRASEAASLGLACWENAQGSSCDVTAAAASRSRERNLQIGGSPPAVLLVGLVGPIGGTLRHICELHHATSNSMQQVLLEIINTAVLNGIQQSGGWIGAMQGA